MEKLYGELIRCIINSVNMQEIQNTERQMTMLNGCETSFLDLLFYQALQTGIRVR